MLSSLVKSLLRFKFFLLSLISISSLLAQNVVQISGIVITEEGDSTIPLPFAHIINKTRHEGTISRLDGYFSLPAMPGDTIQIEYVGYQTWTTVVPDTDRIFLVVRLEPDTLTLQEVVVYPWPSPEQFKQAFLTLQLEEPSYVQTLSPEVLNRLAYETTETPPELAQAQTFSQHVNQFYYYRQLPSSFVNLWAWAKFFQWLKAKKKERE